MKSLRILAILAALGATGASAANMSPANPNLAATVVITAPDGSLRDLSLPAEARDDGALVFTLPRAEADGALFVDIFADCATARTGEDGYWVSQRGMLGFFTRENGLWATRRDWVTLPYFGMKTPRGSFLAVVEGMRFEFDMRLDVTNGLYRMFPRWRVGETGIGPYEDMSLAIYPLADGAGYNEMAKEYRRYKEARDPEIRPLKERAKERPHLLQIARSVAVRQQCAQKPFKRPDDARDFSPETEHPVQCRHSFDDTLEALRKLKALGVDDVAMCVAGWQTGGYDGRAPAVFPVEEAAGGEEGLRRLIEGAKALGYLIDAQDNYTDCYTVSPLWDGGNVACMGTNGVLDVNGSWCGGRAYNLCLRNAWEVQGFMLRDLRRTAGLGFWGCHYIDVFSAAFPYRCLNPAHAANRNEQMRYQIAAAQLCRELFGGFASECCFDHMIGQVDYINYATAKMRDWRKQKKTGFPTLVDKIVPFWELAFHDVVLSNPDKITQEVLKQPENLILVEFGGRPIFYHVGDDNIPGIARAYEQFKELRHLQLEDMVRHDELAEGFVRVRYGNGDAIYVNHTGAPKNADGMSVPAKDFLLVRAGETTSNPTESEQP